MESSRSKRKTKRSLARSFVVTVAVGIPSALLASSGCSSPDRPEPGAGGGPQPATPGAVSGKCTTEGAQQPCHLNLGKSGGGQFQSCFSGTQTCTGGIWSSCGGDGTVTNTVADLNLTPASAGAAQAGLHALGFGGCGDGICGAVKKCQGGPDNGNVCITSASCAGGYPCVAQKTCVGGPDNGDTCSNAGDCGAPGTCTGGAEDCTTCPQDCGPCAPGASSAGVSVCTTDPCSADCLGWNQATAISSAGGAGSSVIGVSGFGQISNGQISKLLLDNVHTGKKCDDYATPGLPSSYYNCQIDTYCQMTQLGGDGNCHQFATGAKLGDDAKALGVNAGKDVTIGPGCSDTEADKYRYFPICNRGTVPIAVGTIIRVKYFNPNTAFNPCPNTSCTAAAGYDCSMKVGDAVSKNGSTATSGLALLPGTCQLLDTQQAGMAPGGAACSQPSGDKWIFANCDGATTGVGEGAITMIPGVTGPPANEPVVAPGTLGCANNWTDHSPSNNPPSCGIQGQSTVTFSSDYHATCPTGTGPVWNKLMFNTVNAMSGGASSEVFFEAATAPDVAGIAGTYSSFYELAETREPTVGAKDPQVCNATTPGAVAVPTCTSGVPGPNPNCCPKDIETLLERSVTALPFPGADPGPGALLARNDWLRLKITLKSTPDTKQNAKINSWSISYQCVARE